MTSSLFPIVSVLAVSLVSFVGLFAISINEQTLKKYVFLLVSLAAGALLGQTFINLIPESYALAKTPILAALAIILGILIFFFLENALHWHHHPHDTGRSRGIRPTGRLILISDSMHNLLDGIIIGASYLAGVEIGIATTIAVILHEIPQEIGDFGILISSGYTRAKALWYNFLSALFAVVGVFFALALGETAQYLKTWMLPVAAGGFIYIAMSDLIPELQKTKGFGRSAAQFMFFIIGVSAILILSVFV